jgi:hypothetical protein
MVLKHLNDPSLEKREVTNIENYHFANLEKLQKLDCHFFGIGKKIGFL